MFLNAFMTGQALLLSSLRILRPRSIRGEGAEQPRNLIDSWPQTRQFHEHGRTQHRAQSQTNRVHEQSASMFSSGKQARQGRVRILEDGKASTARKQALAWNGRYSQTRSDLEQSIAANLASAGIVLEHRRAENSQCRSIAVSILPPPSFLVRIHSIPDYVHV